MPNALPLQLFALRLAVALALGALIGTERAYHHRMAGPRTNALVACGSAAFLMLGSLLGGDGAARIAAQIVSGIGFLGGGVILKEGANVRGLNTSATIWCAAAIGTLAGSGMLLYAGVVAICIVFVNLAFRPLALKLNPPCASEYYYEVEMIARPADVVHCRSLLMNTMNRDTLTLQSMRSRTLDERIGLIACVKAETACDRVLEQLVARLLCDESLAGASWKTLPAMTPVDLSPEAEIQRAVTGSH
ncbi:MAG TPA: MgtC/SapB family protein [Bryobacteraceae bacterium]|nr:MgtC/SapB family protein [Bryobacteraceae bacterium]